MNSKATLYLDEKLLKAAKIKAAHTEKSLSYLVNEALRLSLQEDAAGYGATKEPARGPKSAVLSKKQKSRLVKFFKDSPFHGLDLKIQRNPSHSRKTEL